MQRYPEKKDTSQPVISLCSGAIRSLRHCTSVWMDFSLCFFVDIEKALDKFQRDRPMRILREDNVDAADLQQIKIL